jgi:chromate reductase, NAD(P)H dehydrogenase (quinone)
MASPNVTRPAVEGADGVRRRSLRVLGISGSLRRDSHNTELLRAAATLLPSGVEFELYDGLRDIPPYDEDVRGASPEAEAVTRLKERIAAADAVLFATPEYNHSIPGQLKNALDWVSRPLAETPLRGKPVAVIGASTGMFGAVWAQAELRKVLGAIGARVLDRELPVPTADEIVRDREKLESSGTHSLIVGILAELIEAAEPARAAAAA